VTKWHPATKLLMAAALLALPYLLWTGQSDQAPAVAASVTRAAPDAAEPAAVESPPAQFILPPLERFTAVVERPLFSPTRRMPSPPPSAADAPAALPEASVSEGPLEPELRFFGTVRQSGVAAALVTYPATAEVARLRVGDAVGEWQVIAVDSNRLELGLGEERRSFEIFGAGMRGDTPDSLVPAPAEVQDGEPDPGSDGYEPLPELE
jgi:general secretion pathway protein N